jgi:hypothetical protein
VNTSFQDPPGRFKYYYEDYSIEENIIELVIKRRPLYFMVNAIFPCLILNLITVLSFALPYIPQITLSMTTFLTFSVYSLRIASDIPTQSEYLPSITLYFLLSTSYVLLALSWFICENFFRSNSFLPKPLRFMVHGVRNLIQKVVKCVCLKRKKSKIDSENQVKQKVFFDFKVNNFFFNERSICTHFNN